MPTTRLATLTDASATGIPAPRPEVVPLPPSPHPVPPPPATPPEVRDPLLPGQNEPVRDPVPEAAVYSTLWRAMI